ncbi:MAG: GTP 3',8-cyclase MoaA [Chromatiales bacterium]|nr:GTP 3',8-cyclase MoaA [Gammaproteobacteria bacterium]MBW6476261.1 GTP 3',8-cyclase MoaA [Chromatiales bacterium]
MAPTLTDPFARQIDYIRLSVTDRCDLRCYYCMPEGHTDFEAPEDWLSFDEIERVIAAFGRLGVQRVRVTGGEPLVRKNLSELTTRLARLPGITDLSLSSNAVQMERHAQALFDSGVRRLNISLDTLKPERFKAITQGKLDKVIHGLMAAKAAGFAPIKINMVVMRGVNDDELVEMLEFCRQHGFTLRFIETMPMGDTGRNASAQYLPMDEVITTLKQHYSLIPGVMPGGGPARYMQLAGEAMKIGFITPMSQHFCETCNRVRLSVDGTLYMCLGQDHRFALRPLLRAGISDTELEQAIIQAIALKPERHEFSEKPEQVVRFMSMTGG